MVFVTEINSAGYMTRTLSRCPQERLISDNSTLNLANRDLGVGGPLFRVGIVPCSNCDNDIYQDAKRPFEIVGFPVPKEVPNHENCEDE